MKHEHPALPDILLEMHISTPTPESESPGGGDLRTYILTRSSDRFFAF